MKLTKQERKSLKIQKQMEDLAKIGRKEV